MTSNALVTVFLVSASFSSYGADLPPKTKAAVEQFLTTIHKGACNNIQQETADTADISAVSVVGGIEYVVKIQQDACYCSPTGNCAVFVLAPRSRTFQILLEATSQSSVNVLQSSISHGHPDLVLTMHGSATESDERTYRFDGQRYRRTK